MERYFNWKKAAIPAVALTTLLSSITPVQAAEIMEIDNTLGAEDKGVALSHVLDEASQQDFVRAMDELGAKNTIVEEFDIADQMDEITTVNVTRMRKPSKTLDEIDQEQFEQLEQAMEGNVSSTTPGSTSGQVTSGGVGVDARTVPKVKANYVSVTDAEVKADFRYSLTDAQQKTQEGYYRTYLDNSALKMRIQLEKAFGTKVTKDGGQGRLYDVYFAGSTKYNQTEKGFITFARAFVNSQFSTDLKDNKDVLAKIAAENFADVDGTESYAYLIPTAVYYRIITPRKATDAEVKAGKYKAGDLIVGVKDKITYAKLSKMIAGYDGYRCNATTGKLVGTGYEYMGNLESYGLGQDIMTKEVANKQIVKGELVENLMKQSYLVHFGAKDGLGKKTGLFNDIKKVKVLDLEQSSTQLRSAYQNAIANPSTGVPDTINRRMVAAQEAGINLKDANGNSNWYKTLTVGDALSIFTDAARVDE